MWTYRVDARTKRRTPSGAHPRGCDTFGTVRPMVKFGFRELVEFARLARARARVNDEGPAPRWRAGPSSTVFGGWISGARQASGGVEKSACTPESTGMPGLWVVATPIE